MPPDPTIFEDVVVDESENVNNDQENERICLEISLFFAMKCLDLIQEETESIEEFFFIKVMTRNQRRTCHLKNLQKMKKQ